MIDHLICHNLQAKMRLVSEFQVSSDRVSIIPHGPLFKPVRAIAQHEARVRVALPTDARIVLWQGIVRPYKGISFLLKAWKLAFECGLKGLLVIVGTGSKNLLRAIENEVSSCDLQSSVRLVFRFVSIEELANFYHAADILVYPYSEITTSGAVMTGIGYGKPIVASALPGFEQVLRNEENALLVPYGDVRAWAAALIRLAGDIDLRAQLADGLRRRQGPDWADIARRTSETYSAVLSSTFALGETKSAVAGDATNL